MTEREEKRIRAGTQTERHGERQKTDKDQGREGGMKQQGQGAGTENNGGKRGGWWTGGQGQHKTNHTATRYRAEREELRNRDRELERERWRKTKYNDELSDREEGIKNREGGARQREMEKGKKNQNQHNTATHLWWVDPGQMPGAHQAAPSLPLLNWTGGENKTKGSWVERRTGRSLTNYRHGQNRLDLGKN